MKWGVVAAAVAIVGVCFWWFLRGPAAPARSEAVHAARPVEPTPPVRPAQIPDKHVASRGFTLVGDVLLPDGSPAAGARLTLDGWGNASVEALAGAKGRYRFDCGAPSSQRIEVRVEASLGDKLGGHAWRSIEPGPPREIDMGDLRLETVRTVRVTVEHAGKPVPQALVTFGDPWALRPISRSGEEGVAVLEHVPEETGVEIRAARQGFGRARIVLDTTKRREVTIELPAERRVRIRVVDKRSGKGVAGATFELNEQIRNGKRVVSVQPLHPPLEIFPTDTDGNTIARGLAPETELLLAIRAPGYPPPLMQYGKVGTVLLPRDVTELRIELDPPRTVRWPVVAGELPVPAGGTRIALRPMPNSYLKEVPREGVMQGSDLVVPGWGPGPIQAHAVEPGGGIAALWAETGKPVGRQTSFRKPRAVEIFLHEPDGTPLEGFGFALHDQGNNRIGAPAVSDRTGHAHFENLHGGLVDIYLLDSPFAGYSSERVGTVDLNAGSGNVEVILQPVIELVLRVTVDGRPGLPKGYELSVDADSRGKRSVDRERGEIRMRVRPRGSDGKVWVTLKAPGYLTVRAQARAGVTELALHGAGALVVRVTPPPDGR